MASDVIKLESDYEYVVGAAMGNVLNLQANFASMDWTNSDLKLISKELVNTAKLFAVQQGLGAASFVYDTSINGTPVQIKQKRRNTGTLINSIHADVNGRTINFFNNANLGRGFYAGHIEYGFHDRGGNPVAARPFMRPAFQAVARASIGQLRGTLKAFLEERMLLSSFGLFGSPRTVSGDFRAFYNQPRGPVSGRGSGTYTTQGLLNLRGGMNAQSHWSKLNALHREDGRMNFIGNKNDRGFLNGNQVTRSTKQYANYGRNNKVSIAPRDYTYGKMNTNIFGRSKISYNPKETQARLNTRREEIKQQKQQTKIQKEKEYKTQNPYGRKSDYKQFSDFADRHGMSLREAKSIWNTLKD